MNKRLLEEKRALVAEGRSLRNTLSQECVALSEEYVQVVGGVARAVFLMRAARLGLRIAEVLSFRRGADSTDDGPAGRGS